MHHALHIPDASVFLYLFLSVLLYLFLSLSLFLHLSLSVCLSVCLSLFHARSLYNCLSSYPIYLSASSCIDCGTVSINRAPPYTGPGLSYRLDGPIPCVLQFFKTCCFSRCCYV